MRLTLDRRVDALLATVTIDRAGSRVETLDLTPTIEDRERTAEIEPQAEGRRDLDEVLAMRNRFFIALGFTVPIFFLSPAGLCNVRPGIECS